MKTRVLAFLVPLLLAASGGVQDPSLMIRTTTSLVEVHVVAQDSKGQPVKGLKREDFQILDNRKPQLLKLFKVEGGSAAAASQTAGAQSGGDSQDAGGYAVILVDWTNTLYADRIRVQDEVLKLLDHTQPRQQVALFLLGHEPRLIHDFTSATDALAQAMERVQLEAIDLDDEHPAGRFDARSGSRMTPQMSLEEQIFKATIKVRESLRVLDLIAARLARLPGRKSLVWVSSGFPMKVGPKTDVAFYQDVEKTLARLNRADVAVYSVDAGGLMVVPHGHRNTLEDLASRTGGSLFADRNDLGEGIRLALEDTATGYTLGFHLPDDAAPGVHEIRVRVNRPGIYLRYRESYDPSYFKR